MFFERILSILRFGRGRFMNRSKFNEILASFRHQISFKPLTFSHGGDKFIQLTQILQKGARFMSNNASVSVFNLHAWARLVKQG